jgi:hypothetical protein
VTWCSWNRGRFTTTLYQLGNERTASGLAVFEHGHSAQEIRHWLDLSLAICDRFDVGKDSALALIVYASVLRARERDLIGARQRLAAALRLLRVTKNRYELGQVFRQSAHIAQAMGRAHAAFRSFRRACGYFEEAGLAEDRAALLATFPKMARRLLSARSSLTPAR